VRARRRGARAIIEVSDTGAGVPRELQERIFEPFFTTKPVGVGTRILGGEHDVVFVTSARSALERLRGGEEFDLILCDLMMPDMTGMEFHAELERVQPRLQQEMIFITGGVFTDAAQQFFDSVPNRRLSKPFDIERLREMVRSPGSEAATRHPGSRSGSSGTLSRS
jgi:CheY-like chemotaxis protein